MTSGTDHDCGEGHYPALLLSREAVQARAWGRVDWHPVWTYSTVMLASGWLAGAWYAWQIDADGATMTICLVGALSTIFPGIPWKDLLAIQKQSAKEHTLRAFPERERPN